MRFVSALALVLLLTACKGGDEEVLPATSLDVDGTPREFRLFVPAEPPAEPMPLLVAVHGADGRNAPFPQAEAFQALAEEHGFVVAYALSELMDGNEGEWQLNTGATSRHDLDYIERLINAVAAEHAIDPDRIYGTGYSMGSMFSYELACGLSSRFAAIASYAGSMPVEPADCAPERPVALMHIHGTADPIIPYAETWDWKEWDAVGTMWDIPGLVDDWANRHGCTESDGTAHVVHSGCDGGVRVEHHRLEGVGHGWPETIGGTSTAEVIWDFVGGF